MTENHTLTRHRDIQNWVTDRRGIPAIARVRDNFGELHSQLRLRFAHKEHAKSNPATVDDGISPCSWTAWLAELDRQQLALRISAAKDGFELVHRRSDN